MSRERVDLSVLPIDVGFDLRRHDMAVAVPASTTSAAYDLNGAERVVRGTVQQVVADLQAAGYRASVSRGGMEMLTIDTITDEDIRMLREDALAAGDDEQVDLCRLALGITTTRAWNLSLHGARVRCVDAINTARAQDDALPEGARVKTPADWRP